MQLSMSTEIYLMEDRTKRGGKIVVLYIFCLSSVKTGGCNPALCQVLIIVPNQTCFYASGQEIAVKGTFIVFCLHNGIS